MEGRQVCRLLNNKKQQELQNRLFVFQKNKIDER